MFHESADNLLGAGDLLQVIMRFTEKFSQPFPAANGSGKIQFVKNRELFFRVEDGNVVEGLMVYLHIGE